MIVTVVYSEAGAYSDKTTMNEAVFCKKEDAIKYINDLGFTKERYEGWIRPDVFDSDSQIIYYTEDWEAH